MSKLDIDVNDRGIVISEVIRLWFEIYLTAEQESDRKEVAYFITSLRDDIKNQIVLWYLIEDKTEFNRLVDIKISEINNTNKIAQKRRHEKRNDFSLSDEEWRGIVEHFNNQCAYCGSDKKLTYDHFHPFSKGGDFMKGNVVPACKSCNSSKNNKLFEEWYEAESFYSKERESKIQRYVENNRQLTLI